MLITKEVKLKWGNNRKIYEPKGYSYTKHGEEFIVKIEDLSEGSNVIVSYICDYCKQPQEIAYSVYVKKKKKNTIDKDCCLACAPIKIRESMLLQYGCTNPANKEVDIKNIKQTFIDRGYIPMFDEYINSKIKLPYICPKHEKEGLQHISYGNLNSNGRGCKFCGRESSEEAKRKYSLEDAVKVFELKDYTLHSTEFESLNKHLKYTCNKHPELSYQFISYACAVKNEHNCKQCRNESRRGENSYQWKGGLSPLSHKLRYYVIPWNEDSRKASDGKCVITGEDTATVHHLHPFHLIVEETLDFFGMKQDNLKEIQLNDISNELLLKLKDKCLELHYNYGLGVCLTDDIHYLFHDEYGRNYNTPEQFYEFKQRYLDGEFTDESEHQTA